MRGTAAILVCLISLHYLSVIDAYTARFTSEDGRPGREHEDKHPRRTAGVKRSLSETMRQEPDYNWENYGGIPNIPGYMYRDEYINTELDDYEDTDVDILPRNSRRRLNPGDQPGRRSDGASLSASPDKALRQVSYYYDDWEQYGGIPNIPGYRDAGTDVDTDADKNSISKTLKRLLSPVVDAVRQLWGKLSGKSLESAGGEDTKRQNSGGEPLKKRTTGNRNDTDRVTTRKRNISNPLKYLTDIAKKALEFAYNLINKIDVSQLTEEAKKLKEAVLEILKKAKDSLEELLNNVSSDLESPYSRRTRSVGKRTNARDALESYLTSLRSHKRSRTRNPSRRSMKGNTSARASDMTALMDLMTEMEECIRKIPPTNTSRLGVKCIVLPLMKALGSPKPGGASGLTTDADFNVRSDKIESGDNLRRLSFPWGSIFLIPVYNGQPPPDNETIPPYYDQIFDNVTTTTTTTTTLEPPTTTTEALPAKIQMELDKAPRSDGKYRSKYDNDY